jgi:exocyst complex component 1
MLLGDQDGIIRPGGKSRAVVVIQHKDMEQYLGRYSGLMLYLKEMDEGVYAKLCAVCNPRLRDLHFS